MLETQDHQVQAAGKSGRLDADYACIEVDEMASVRVFPLLKPDCVLVTNIFRDQLDRTCEVDITCGQIQKAMQTVPEAKLITNCDDICSMAYLLLHAGCGMPEPEAHLRHRRTDRGRHAGGDRGERLLPLLRLSAGV